MKLAVDQIRANPWNCNYMGKPEQEALKQRLITQSSELMEPLIVRLMPDGTYEIVDGEHRWRIAQELGWITIEVHVLEADDLTAKTRCVSSSILRGHVNWFKLSEVVKQDQKAGVDLAEAYKDILSDKTIKELFSLTDLVPKARLDLEEAVKKFASITLSDLHIISQFPAHLQEELAEEYKTHPITSHSLAHTLDKYTKQNQPPTTTLSNPLPYLPEEDPSQASSLAEKFDKLFVPNDTLRRLNALKKQQRIDTCPEQTKIPNRSELGSCDNSSPEALCSDVPEDNSETFHALLLSVGFCCKCDRPYHAHFKDRVHAKNVDIVVQKENLIFEHVDVKSRVFLVHCDRCNSTQEVMVDNLDEASSAVGILCRHCQPAREGALDVTTGDAVWFG
ncbi:MAG: ParB/RepB/Spo0J family partition protein [Nitrososphaerota archaeon]|jgi:ParB-like chromosome segregation protein Spo0J|nr:ParB/RepB/Spo0J family partition protein [Candidatus Termiticorpusculum sp.]MDR0492408.1 ParB/RepB/Spo0J family partition protein [Nitrososphaerota archaeon]